MGKIKKNVVFKNFRGTFKNKKTIVQNADSDSKSLVKSAPKGVEKKAKSAPKGVEKKHFKKEAKKKLLEKKKKKPSKVKDDGGDEEQEKLTLDLIKELGGEAADLELIEKGGETEAIEGKELDSKGEQELKNLISSLKLNKYTIDKFIIKDKVALEEETEKPPKEKKKKDETKASKDGKVQENEVTSTTPQTDSDDSDDIDDRVIKSDFSFVKNTPDRNYCVIKTGEKWFSSINTPVAESVPGNMPYWLPKIIKYTEKVWAAEVVNYEASGTKNPENKSEREWMKTVLKSGTLTDKMSAYVVQIQASPVNTLPVLESLLAMVSLKSRRPCLLALGTLTQLLLDDLLVPDRKLKPFDKNPFHKLQELTGGNKDTRDRYLITWMFEDKLKDFYHRFIQAMEVVGKDTIENTRVKVISCTQQLLSGCPEQEQLHLERLINRLGDPTRAVAAKAMHHLNQLIEQHPSMKDVMVKEVERLLYRPNISPKAQYYGICFLSQLMLDRHQGSAATNLASKLVNIYFSFFKLTIKKGEIDTKLMSALLTGVNRAFPYSSLEPKQLDQQMETMHKLVHMVSFNISVQTLTLLYQIMDSRDSVNDRFYSALYRKILDPAFALSSKQVMFLNLLFNSVRKDSSVPRVRAFIKRLLQCCEFLPSHSTAGVLFIISEIIRNRKDLGSLRSVLESEDGNIDFSRFDDDSDGEEHYDDVKDDDDNNDGDVVDDDGVVVDDNDDDEVKEEDDDDNKDDVKLESGWVFKNKSANKHKVKTTYDPQARNPLYAGAEKSPFWELESLVNHFHPTVQMFAKSLSDNTSIVYPGDPLNDFTIPKFLDRFVFRNPKKDPAKNKPTTIHGRRNIYRPAGIKAVAPDSKDFVGRAEGTIPGDEIFIHRYFTAKAERAGNEKEEDAGSVTSEDFNDFLDKMGGRTKDFDDEDIDFAGGLDGESEEEEGGDDEDEDEDEEKEDADSEPEGLDGEDEDGFKDLSDSENEEGDDDDDVDLAVFDADGDDDMNEEDINFSDDEDEDQPPKKKSKKLKTSKKRAVFDGGDLSGLLADAEEFSHLLEQNDDAGTSSSVSTKDKAGPKQLKWEEKTNAHMKGNKWSKGGKGAPGGGKGASGPKRGNKSNFVSRKGGKPPFKKHKK